MILRGWDHGPGIKPNTTYSFTNITDHVYEEGVESYIHMQESIDLSANIHVSEHGAFFVPSNVSVKGLEIVVRGRWKGMKNLDIGDGSTFTVYPTASTMAGKTNEFSLENINVFGSGQLSLQGSK